MLKYKKIALASSLLVLLTLGANIGYRTLPIVKSKESFRSFFPTDRFQKKLQDPTPQWMSAQIQTDFQGIAKITTDAVEDTYKTIRSRVGNNIRHYRILDNKLYKYAPKRSEFPNKDDLFEKAFKTLLISTKVPDVDFIVCPMDGIPEPYMPKDFYLTENQAPILGKAKLNNAKYIVLIPDQFSLSDDWFNTSQEILALNQEIPWSDKSNTAVWRGTLTDTGFPDNVACPYSTSPRYKLSQLSAAHPDLIDAGFIPAGANIESLAQENLIKQGLSKKEHLLSKYQPVMDGHMCTFPGYQWRLLSNSIALKQESNQIQWFYGALEPYKHYLPVQNDLSDLIDKIAWAKENDEKLLIINKKAQEFALNNLMLEDNYKYLLLVLNHYASLQEIDFKELKKSTEKDPAWKCIQYRSRLRMMKTLKNILNY